MTPVLEPDSEQLPPPPADADPVGATPVAPPPAAAVEPAEPPSRRSGWHVAAIVIGALVLLPGLGSLLGGTALVVAQNTATDDGFFDVTLDRVHSDGVAIATVDLWETADDDDAPWVLDWLDIDVRLWADGAAESDELFVGIARTEDVEAYLAGTEHSEITGFDDRAPDYLERAGSATIDPPADLDIWDSMAAGPGEQVVTWEARNGDWSVVVMNADGSPDVAADVEVGIRSDAITPIGVVMIVFGSLVLIGGTVLIVVGARGRRDG